MTPKELREFTSRADNRPMRSVFGKASFSALAFAALALGLSACHGHSAGSDLPAGPTPSPAPSGTATPLPPVSTANSIGMNVGSVLDTETNRIFADAMKTSRIPWTAGLANAAADSNGWPAQDAAIQVWANSARMDGTYALAFQGSANVQTSGCVVSTLTASYNPGTNTSTAQFTIPGAAACDLTLTFTNTHVAVGAAQGTGVKNVTLMRPTYEGSTSSYAVTTTFTTDFKNSLAPFSTLRFTDWLASNGNTQQYWTDRVTPASASQVVLAGAGSQVKGAAYEYAFQLCNETQKDCWINIPVSADDAYVQNLARLAQSTLQSNLHLYVEFSNEVWNQNYSQYSANAAAAQSNLTVLKFDGSTNSNSIAYRRIAQRAAQISTIFRSIFGDGAMMTRVRPVLMTQLGGADGSLQQAVHLMEDYYNSNNAARVTTPHPLNYYFYGLGGGADYTPSDESSVSAIFSSLTPATWQANLRKDAAYAAAFGVRRIAYEGGPDFAKSQTANAFLQAAHDDPGIVQAIVGAHNAWSANGGDLLVYYTLTGDFTWGFLDDVYDLGYPPRNYKLQAMTQLGTGIRPAPAYGPLVPASLPATAFDVPSSALQTEGVGSFSQGTWFGYVARVGTPGTFAVGLHAGSADGKGTAEIWVDGNFVGTLTATHPLAQDGTASATSTLPVTLNAGLHGIVIRGAAATSKISVTSVDVTQGP
jgi:hypothetical protein